MKKMIKAWLVYVGNHDVAWSTIYNTRQEAKENMNARTNLRERKDLGIHIKRITISWEEGHEAN